MPVVKFYASLRKLTGTKEIVVSGATIRTILETLTDDFPNLKNLFFGGDRVRAILILNGHTLDPQTAIDTTVSEQDQVAIFPPISGG